MNGSQAQKPGTRPGFRFPGSGGPIAPLRASAAARPGGADVGEPGSPCWNLFSVSSPGTYPENKLTTKFNYSSGPLTAHLAWRWIDGSDNAAPLYSEARRGISDPVLAAPQVASWSYFDLGLAYQWDNGLLLRLGINNLFDKDPPLMGDSQLENNTDALMYDVFGRTYYLNLRYQFAF